MSLTSRSARTLAVGSLTAIASLGALAAPSMAATTTTLNAACTVPLLSATQPATIAITTSTPAKVKAGVPTALGALSVTTALAGNTPDFFNLIAAASVEGNTTLKTSLVAPGVSVAITAPTSFASTPIPDPTPASVALKSTGSLPTVAFPRVGQATLSATGVTVTVLARDFFGDPIIGIPGSDPVTGTFDIPCTINAGQATKLATIKITK